MNGATVLGADQVRAAEDFVEENAVPMPVSWDVRLVMTMATATKIAVTIGNETTMGTGKNMIVIVKTKITNDLNAVTAIARK